MSSLRRYLIFIAVLITAVLAISFAMSWPLGLVALAVFVGWPLVGTLITIDDDLPGGWSNPDGKTVPEWKTLDWNLEIIMCRGAIVLLAFAFQYRSDQNLALMLFAVSGLIGYFGFRRLTKMLSLRDLK